MLEPVYDIRNCGPRHRFSANGKLVHNSNWQNFKRGSDIRKAIMAPEGYLLAPIDLSQIECVAEGQRILTHRGWKVIESITVDDFVFDGVAFVKHSGVVYKGERDVILVDGLKATSDHVIYPHGFPNGIALGVFEATGRCFAASRRQNAVRLAALRSPFLFRLQNLWCPRNPFQIRHSKKFCFMGTFEFTTPHLQQIRNRPYRQRRPLRTWKFTIINAARKCQQSLYDILGAFPGRLAFSNGRFQTRAPGMQVWPRWNQRPSGAWFSCGGHYRAFQKFLFSDDVAETQKKRLQTSPRSKAEKTKVYDILNCGPRHRFVCEGVTVSNCRLLNYLAGQEDVVEKFRNGEDPYIGIASQAYGFPVTKAHVTERGTGKQLELSCGYQAGAATIKATARLGIYGPPVTIDLETALRWRDLYRSTHPAVVEYWRVAGRLIARIGGGEPLPWGPMTIKDKKIFGPGGTFLNYTTLEYHQVTKEEYDAGERDGYWRIRTRHGWSKLYSGRLVENVVQWLARIVMSQALIRIARLGYRVVNCTHDELLVLVKKDGNEQRHLESCKNEMVREPTWLPGIPLDCEGSLGERYSK